MENCHVLFQVTEKLALNAGLASPFQTQAHLSQSIFQDFLSRDGLAHLIMIEREGISKTTQE